MQPYQREFADLLIRHSVVRFGEFTLKSGRTSPYFCNAGQLRTGQSIRGVGAAYASAIRRAQIQCDLVFGPAYKGVPLAVATAMELSQQLATDVPFGFDRKEPKDHGEGGIFVGTQPQDGQHIVLVDDVVTSGRSIREAVTMLKQAADVTISGVIVAVDRQERGNGPKTTVTELREELGVNIYPIVTITELCTYLRGHQIDGQVALDEEKYQAIQAYLAQHGGQEA